MPSHLTHHILQQGKPTLPLYVSPTTPFTTRYSSGQSWATPHRGPQPQTPPAPSPCAGASPPPAPRRPCHAVPKPSRTARRPRAPTARVPCQPEATPVAIATGPCPAPPRVPGAGGALCPRKREIQNASDGTGMVGVLTGVSVRQRSWDGPRFAQTTIDFGLALCVALLHRTPVPESHNPGSHTRPQK
ncbi:predicted GPI-anchored protein 58 [Pipra filicauda]|uniref:Predicted GPI-anchored protein 58 n=1 Tax=Pipra filicauda TaxID=649802 RepID=A0A7R5KC84_9PASS|nr:predicted GPI-anchored protein 58 [Pipra filicauda]